MVYAELSYINNKSFL